MRVLLLGRQAVELKDFLESSGEQTFHSEEPLDALLSQLHPEDFLVSYGYRYLVRPHHLAFFSHPPINLHISYLPWNRGADPNLWSFLENSPKGVTIHQIDEGLDTGAILLQKHLEFSKNESLASSYEKLHLEIQKLFKENWPALRDRQLPLQPQVGAGSVHRLKDKIPFEHLLTDGWNTPIERLIGKGIQP